MEEETITKALSHEINQLQQKLEEEKKKNIQERNKNQILENKFTKFQSETSNFQTKHEKTKNLISNLQQKAQNLSQEKTNLQKEIEELSNKRKQKEEIIKNQENSISKLTENSTLLTKEMKELEENRIKLEEGRKCFERRIRELEEEIKLKRRNESTLEESIKNLENKIEKQERVLSKRLEDFEILKKNEAANVRKFETEKAVYEEKINNLMQLVQQKQRECESLTLEIDTQNNNAVKQIEAKLMHEKAKLEKRSQFVSKQIQKYKDLQSRIIIHEDEIEASHKQTIDSFCNTINTLKTHKLVRNMRQFSFSRLLKANMPILTKNIKGFQIFLME